MYICGLRALGSFHNLHESNYQNIDIFLLKTRDSIINLMQYKYKQMKKENKNNSSLHSIVQQILQFY